jgi:hypothetical protein
MGAKRSWLAVQLDEGQAPCFRVNRKFCQAGSRKPRLKAIAGKAGLATGDREPRLCYYGFHPCQCVLERGKVASHSAITLSKRLFCAPRSGVRELLPDSCAVACAPLFQSWLQEERSFFLNPTIQEEYDGR